MYKNTLPNILTMIRIILIPVFVGIFFIPASIISLQTINYIAAILFVLASLTDWFDGYLARKLDQTTDFGAFLDPVADKLIVAAALIMLVELDRTFAIFGIIIIGREICISALREWMANIGKRSKVAVAKLGKYKTAAQMVSICVLLVAKVPLLDKVFLAINNFISKVPYLNKLIIDVDLILIGNCLLFFASILTIISLIYYFKLAMDEFAKD